jgi:hypothetical protein
LGPATPIVFRLFDALKRRGVDVFLASHGVIEDDRVFNLGRVESFLDYFKFYKINHLIKFLQPDIVHAHILNHYGFMSIFSSRPVVVALWGSEIMLDPYEGKWLRRLILFLINKISLKKATRIHTSGSHVALEAIKQCSSIKSRTEFYYWGFPIPEPSSDEYIKVAGDLDLEFDIGEKLIVFNRGLSSVYNPEGVAKIINKLISLGVDRRRLIVLKAFSSNNEVNAFKNKVEFSKIVFVDRLLTNSELYTLYKKTSLHISIPLSDSLGGGVIEPAILGSFPVLSALPSYIEYAKKNTALVIHDVDKELDFIVDFIVKEMWMNTSSSGLAHYNEDNVIDKILSTYQKALG